MEPLLINVTTTPAATVMQLSGEVRIDVSALELEIRKVTAQQPSLVVLDLSSLNFISSLGMGSLVGLRKAVTQRGGAVRLAAPRPMVKDALGRARLLDVFEHFDSVRAALDAPIPPKP